MMVTIRPSRKNGCHVKAVSRVLDSPDVQVFVIEPHKDHFQADVRGKAVEVSDYDDWHPGSTVVRFALGDGHWTGTCGRTSYGKMTVVFVRKGMPKAKVPHTLARAT